jgi:hypothetical protein
VFGLDSKPAFPLHVDMYEFMFPPPDFKLLKRNLKRIITIEELCRLIRQTKREIRISEKFVRYEVFSVVNVNITVFWYMTPPSLV